MDSALKDSFLTAEYKKEHAFTLSHVSSNKISHFYTSSKF
jgi:hypothetical protein